MNPYQQLQQLLQQQRSQFGNMSPQQIAQAQAQAQALVLAMQNAAAAAAGRSTNMPANIPANMQLLQNLALARPQNSVNAAAINALAAAQAHNNQLLNSANAAQSNQLAAQVQNSQLANAAHAMNNRAAQQHMNLISSASGVSQDTISTVISSYNMKLKQLELKESTATTAQAKQKIQQAKDQLNNEFNAWKMSLLKGQTNASEANGQTPSVLKTPTMNAAAMNLQVNAANSTMLNLAQQHQATVALAKQAQQQLQNQLVTQQQQVQMLQQQQKIQQSQTPKVATPVLKPFQIPQSSVGKPSSPSISAQSISRGPPTGPTIFPLAPQINNRIFLDSIPTHGLTPTQMQQLPGVNRMNQMASISQMLNASAMQKRALNVSPDETLQKANYELEEIANLTSSNKRSRLAEVLSQEYENVKLTDESKKVLLELADEFVEQMTMYACQLAKHRGVTSESGQLTVNDFLITLEKNWNLRVSSSNDAVRISKKLAPSQAYQTRVMYMKRAIQEEMLTSRLNEDDEEE